MTARTEVSPRLTPLQEAVSHVAALIETTADLADREAIRMVLAELARLRGILHEHDARVLSRLGIPDPNRWGPR